ncbi:hypothetical protein KA977_13285, partial [Candidatus Dependentiae bacterium]|nr:hypothetical protein [Candidatus Dependentiae bacterium]
LVPGILSLKDAKILSENAGSSMDNSDGLYSSLWYMLEKNNNGCIINFSDIPIHDETKKIVETGKYEIEKLINFGEDYNCIFTGYSGNIEKIENTIKSKITVIGEITDDGKKIVIKNGKKILLKREGFIHNE